MALEDDIRILSAVGLFSELTDEQLRLLAFGAETMRFSAGREIYAEGAPADSAFVISLGKVVLFRKDGGDFVSVARYGPGTILGEMALIANSKRLTGAAADTDVEALRVSRAMFRRILEQYPDLAASLHRHIAADLEALIRKIEQLAPRFG